MDDHCDPDHGVTNMLKLQAVGITAIMGMPCSVGELVGNSNVYQFDQSWQVQAMPNQMLVISNIYNQNVLIST